MAPAHRLVSSRGLAGRTAPGRSKREGAAAHPHTAQPRDEAAWSRGHEGSADTVAVMRAVICRGLAGPEVLSIRQVPAPQPHPGEIVIDVAASAVNATYCSVKASTHLHRCIDHPRPGMRGKPSWQLATR
jgi:hypothetical protein